MTQIDADVIDRESESVSICVYLWATLLLAIAILTSPMALYHAISDPESSLGFGLLIALLPVLFAAVPVGMLWVAGRLRRGDPNAKGAATLISFVLLSIAFPISTFAGVFFLSRLNKYYDDYRAIRLPLAVP
jgi:hypothetical protein